MILYFIILFLVLFAFSAEQMDKGSNLESSLAYLNDRKHVLIRPNMASPSDTPEIAQQKILQLSVAEGKRIYWRNAILFGLVITVLASIVFFLLEGSVEVKVFVIFFLTAGVIYFMQNHVNYHFNSVVSEVIKENLNTIMKNL